MPSITIYTSENHKIENEAFSEFSICLKQLTQKVLKAKDDNIHIAYLTTDIGYEEVMKTYLHQVDLLIEEKMAVKARIRCFMYDVDNIFAKN